MEVCYGDLIRCCMQLLDGFDSESVAIEDHMQDFLMQCQDLGDTEKTFIREVFVGCVRYSSVLDVVVDGYYNCDGQYALNSERCLYTVVTYLVLFRLDELGLDSFKKCIKSQHIRKLTKFLNFALNDRHILTWMKDEWNKLYDAEFVQTTILDPLLRWLPCLLKMLEKFCLTSDCANKATKKTCKPVTEPRPFNMTQPKPKRVPVPEQIPVVGKHKPVPKTTYQCPTDEQILDATRAENRRKAMELHDWVQDNSPSYTQTGKSAKTLQRMQDFVDYENSKLCFDGCVDFKPVPASMNDNVPIKLNAAAIMREEMLYRKREEIELKKLDRLEAGEGDSTGFEEWQATMRKRDLEKQLEEIELRRLSGLLSQEEAIIARQRMVQLNKERVADMKTEAQWLMNDYMLRQLLKQEETKKLMEKVIDSHENAKEAKRKMQAYKAQIVQAMNEESRELMRRALEDAEVEMRQKMELIRDIRAMEASSAAQQPKTIDLTETAGYGLLCEMSIAELRERLQLLEAAEVEQEEMKRCQIINDKHVKTQMLLDKVNTISKHRTELVKAAAIRADERRKAQMAKSNPSRNVPVTCALMDMNQTLADRRAERRRLEQLQTIGQTPSNYGATQCRSTADGKSRMTLLAN